MGTMVGTGILDLRTVEGVIGGAGEGLMDFHQRTGLAVNFGREQCPRAVGGIATAVKNVIGSLLKPVICGCLPTFKINPESHR